jgi:hypothetical protein
LFFGETFGFLKRSKDMSKQDINWVEDIEAMHRGYWFTKGAVRFFKSRICGGGRVFGGRYFVTSEKGPYGPRAYSVREYDRKNDSINTVGKFRGFRTAAQAIARAKELAKEK